LSRFAGGSSERRSLYVVPPSGGRFPRVWALRLARRLAPSQTARLKAVLHTRSTFGILEETSRIAECLFDTLTGQVRVGSHHVGRRSAACHEFQDELHAHPGASDAGLAVEKMAGSQTIRSNADVRSKTRVMDGSREAGRPRSPGQAWPLSNSERASRTSAAMRCRPRSAKALSHHVSKVRLRIRWQALHGFQKFIECCNVTWGFWPPSARVATASRFSKGSFPMHSLMCTSSVGPCRAPARHPTPMARNRKNLLDAYWFAVQNYLPVGSDAEGEQRARKLLGMEATDARRTARVHEAAQAV